MMTWLIRMADDDDFEMCYTCMKHKKWCDCNK